MARKQAKHHMVTWNIQEIPNIVKFPGCTIPEVRFRNLDKYLDFAPVHRVQESRDLNKSIVAERDAAMYLDMNPMERRTWRRFNGYRYKMMKAHSKELFTDLLRRLKREDLLKEHNFDDTPEELEEEPDTVSLGEPPASSAPSDLAIDEQLKDPKTFSKPELLRLSNAGRTSW